MSKDMVERFVHAAEIQIAFTDVSGEDSKASKTLDPVYKLWDNELASEPNDKRSLLDKINAVCNSYTQRAQGRLARNVQAASLSKESLQNKPEFRAMEFRIFQACEEQLDQQGATPTPMTQQEVDAVIKDLVTTAKSKMQDWSKVYEYELISDSLIESVVLGLFEECFLRFEN